jgi:transcriptional antiterminator NusG
MKWYIIQAHSGSENSVSDKIKEDLEKAGLIKCFGEILVPTHDVTDVKKGKRSIQKKKFFPGYILAKLDMNDNVYHVIKSIKKVTGFLGVKGKPSPLSEDEVNKIIGNIKESISNPSAMITFQIGEQVKVCDGPFASFNGSIEEIDEEKSRLKVSVSIFGRPTPVDLDYSQVEKL